jgi:hypothetical protein
MTLGFDAAARRRARLLAAVLVTVACLGCAPPSRTAGPAAAASTTASSSIFTRSVPPPARIPDAVVLAGDGGHPSTVLQRGTLYADTWISDGRISTVAPMLPVPWPAPADLPTGATDEIFASIPSVPAPSWVDVRVYGTVGHNGVPPATALAAVTCDPSTDPCAVRGPGGVPSIRLSLNRGGPRLIIVNAAWPVPRALRPTVRMPAGMITVRAAWLFRLTPDR